MAQKPMPTTLKKEGRRNVTYRDVDGKTYAALVTSRTSATVVNLMIRCGGMKRALTSVAQATSGTKQTNVWFNNTGH